MTNSSRRPSVDGQPATFTRSPMLSESRVKPLRAAAFAESPSSRHSSVSPASSVTLNISPMCGLRQLIPEMTPSSSWKLLRSYGATE